MEFPDSHMTIRGTVRRTEEGLRLLVNEDPGRPLRVTSVLPQAAILPEAGEQNLGPYEEKDVEVRYQQIEYGWVYGVTNIRPAD